MTAVLPTHPLEPLTADEIAATAAILREEKGLTLAHRFVFVALHEPAKADLLAGNEVPREKHVVLYERGARATWEAVVSLTEGSVMSWTAVEGIQPPRLLTWLRAAPGEHGYALPVEGLIVVVDLDAGVVVDVTDHGVVPFPTLAGNYEEPSTGTR